MARSRTIAAVVLLVVLSPLPGRAAGMSAPDADGPVRAVTVDSTVPADGATDTTIVWRVENDPSECINSNPRPNCGYKPQDAGERGGALQVSVFFIMIGALAVIGTIIGRNVVKRDRAIAAEIARRESQPDV